MLKIEMCHVGLKLLAHRQSIVEIRVEQGGFKGEPDYIKKKDSLVLSNL